MKPRHITEIRAGLRYDTAAATLIAGDDWHDGHNFEREGRNRFLYRTAAGRYFLAYQSTRPGEPDSVSPVNVDVAIAAFDALRQHRCTWEEAFPGLEIGEA